MNSRGPKFTFFDGEQDVAYDYGNRFFEQTMSQDTRLVVGPSEGHVQLMLSLAAELDRESKSGQFYVLFVLLLSRKGRREPGRYQSNVFQSLEELATFMWSFQDFFESDGRHHVWIGHRQGTIVYDQHNVLFVYGPIERLRAFLSDLGFREEKFWFPAPHGHHYRSENDADEDRLLESEEWTHFPLQKQDEW